MEEERLKDILLNAKPGDYFKIQNHIITKADVTDFYNLYVEFKAAEDRYHKMVLGRKEASLDLVKKLELLEQMSSLIFDNIRFQKSHYEKAAKDLKDTRIEDYDKALKVLRALASNDSIEYDIKTITFPAFDSSERHGYRTTSEYTGVITILGEKSSLSGLDDSKKLPVLTQKMLKEIYQLGFSMILTGNDEYHTERLDLPNKLVIGYYQPIVCYLQNDELEKAISALTGFIEENGADFEQISVEDLVKAIKDRELKLNRVK